MNRTIIVAEGGSERFKLGEFDFRVRFDGGAVDILVRAGDIDTFRGSYDFRNAPASADAFEENLGFTGRIYRHGPRRQFYSMTCWTDEVEQSVANASESSYRKRPAKDYEIRAHPTATGPYTVDVDIESNLPDGSVLKVVLSLQGRQQEDLFVGTDFMRVPLEEGKAHVTIDGTKRALPGGKLPKGIYDLEVSFRPGWQENARIAKRAGIQERIAGIVPVALAGAGKPASPSRTLSSGQRWVIANFEKGMRWGSFWKRFFGPPKKVRYTPKQNRENLAAYYYESIDITLIVDRQEYEVLDWRFGSAHK